MVYNFRDPFDSSKEKPNYAKPKVIAAPGEFYKRFLYPTPPDHGIDYFGPQVDYHINRRFMPLHLEVTPGEFEIDPVKGTKFSVKSLSNYPQDVIIECHSYLFEIKNARRKIGMTSQFFHVMKKDETKEFEIVMRGPKDTSKENYEVIRLPDLPCGLLAFTHYKSRIAGSYTKPKVTDSDAEWGMEGTKLLLRTASSDRHYHGYWEKMLNLKFMNEEAEKRYVQYVEFRHPMISKHFNEHLSGLRTRTMDYHSDESLKEIDEMAKDLNKKVPKELEEEVAQKRKEHAMNLAKQLDKDMERLEEERRRAEAEEKAKKWSFRKMLGCAEKPPPNKPALFVPRTY